MREGPYVRPNLAATRDGVPDPAIEVEVWLDRLETILASEGPDWSAHGAYDLLAGWAKLKRARADLIHSLGAGKELADAQRVLSERGPDVAQLALTVPNPPAWREETVTLEACYERLIDPVERSSLAERLITDLDDAELVLYAVDRLGIKEPILEQEISECRVWLMEHADLFLATSVHIQAVGMALRADLSEYDYSLAMTALKYERLLDAAEETEAELALESLRPIGREVIEALRIRFEWEQAQEATRGSVAAFPRSRLRQARLAAASEATPPSILRWSSPDGRWVAYLPLLSEGKTLTVRLYVADGEKATLLAGQPVFLAGVAGSIDSDARAEFSLEGIEESGHDLSLEVGEPRLTWKPEVE